MTDEMFLLVAKPATADVALNIGLGLAVRGIVG